MSSTTGIGRNALLSLCVTLGAAMASPVHGQVTRPGKKFADGPVTAAPVSFVGEPFHNFGTVRPGSEHADTVTIRNEGALPIRFAKAMSSCPCLEAEVRPELIPAGETAEVEVHLDAPYEVHDVSAKTIQLFFDGHDISTNLRVIYSVDYPIVAVDRTVDFDRKPRGIIRVRSRDKEPFRVLSINGEPARFANHDPETEEPKHFYKVRYDLSDVKAPPELIVIETDHPESPIVSVVNSSRRSVVRAKAFRKGNFRSMRSMVNVQAIDPGETVEFEVEALSEHDIEDSVMTTSEDPDLLWVDVVDVEQLPYHVPRNKRWRITCRLSMMDPQHRGVFYTPILLQSPDHGYQARLYCFGKVNDPSTNAAGEIDRGE